MNVFEIVGRAQLLRDESNRQLAASLSQGVRNMAHRIGLLFASASRRTPVEPQVR